MTSAAKPLTAREQRAAIKARTARLRARAAAAPPPLPNCLCAPRSKPEAWLNAPCSVFALFCVTCGARTPPMQALAAAHAVWRKMMEPV